MEIGDYITENQDALESWGQKIAQSVVGSYGHLLKVPAQVRVKDPASARAKQLRKNYSDPMTQMTDLVGVRFVVLTSRDLAPIRSHIETSEHWAAAQARDPSQEIAKAPSVFEYQSHHYELRAREASLVADAATANLCCEVQVRTILQHAHAELTHDTLYKPSQQVPSEAERLVARSMALMEITDDMLCRAIEAVRIANEPRHALRMMAQQIVGSLGGSTPQATLEMVLDAFGGVIDQSAPRRLQEFFDRNQRVRELLGQRFGRGLFAFPEIALIAYWLTDAAEEDLLANWPLPGSASDVELILSDMGIGA